VLSGLINFIPGPGLAKEFLVAIDVGHSVKQPGAISSRGVGEYIFNKRIAGGVDSRIKAQNSLIKSLLISPEENSALAERPRLAAIKKADLFISIHHDSVQSELLSFWEVQGKQQHYCDLYKGYSIFYSENNGNPYDSLLFAIFLGSEMLKNKLTPSLHHAEYIKGENKPLIDAEKGIYKYNGLAVLKNATMPAVLLECGIIVNRDEELELSKPEYQEKIILSITRAIKRYWEFKHSKVEANYN
jgi:N-acetylmuramoyl-L-alanine amidase